MATNFFLHLRMLVPRINYFSKMFVLARCSMHWRTLFSTCSMSSTASNLKTLGWGGAVPYSVHASSKHPPLTGRNAPLRAWSVETFSARGFPLKLRF